VSFQQPAALRRGLLQQFEWNLLKTSVNTDHQTPVRGEFSKSTEQRRAEDLRIRLNGLSSPGH
jgi:hypothetical protein